MVDDDDNAIWERITENKAKEYYYIFQELKAQKDEDVKRVDEWRALETRTDEQQRKLVRITSPDFGDGDQYVKDELFIKVGEDVEDIFKAFKYWKCEGTA